MKLEATPETGFCVEQSGGLAPALRGLALSLAMVSPVVAVVATMIVRFVAVAPRSGETGLAATLAKRAMSDFGGLARARRDTQVTLVVCRREA